MIRSTLLALALVGLATAATAQTWEENLAAGAATTKKNHLNVPFKYDHEHEDGLQPAW